MSVTLECDCGAWLSMDHEVIVTCSRFGRRVTNVDWYHPEEVVIKDGYVFRKGSEWGRAPLSEIASLVEGRE